MKELSIKEKAKAYDEALEKARKELQACGSTDCDAARQIFRFFPELKESESEDERIRKEIIAFLTYYHTGQGNSVKYDDGWIAWLEKQNPIMAKSPQLGGQKSAWSKEDENILEAITYTVKNSGYSHCIGVSIKVMIAWLKSLKERIIE